MFLAVALVLMGVMNGVCKLQMKDLFYEYCMSVICYEGGPRQRHV